MFVMSLLQNCQMIGRPKRVVPFRSHTWFNSTRAWIWSMISRRVLRRNIARNYCRQSKNSITTAGECSMMEWLQKPPWMVIRHQQALHNHKHEPRAKTSVEPTTKSKALMKLILSKQMDITSMSSKAIPSQFSPFLNLAKSNLHQMLRLKGSQFP
ncbi:MAG: Uncharacterised protein [Euryarchaeota archaeon UBA443]|nr:MAG: Uncharacterised protein [Euryarchaeota archaeon UBA443]